MELTDLPGRVFLDTSVVNFMLEFGEQIYDGANDPEGLDSYQIRDIDALYNIFLAGRRADWQVAVSPFTYYEISHTADGAKRRLLGQWFVELWDHWNGVIDNDPELTT